MLSLANPEDKDEKRRRKTNESKKIAWENQADRWRGSVGLVKVTLSEITWEKTWGLFDERITLSYVCAEGTLPASVMLTKKKKPI